MAIPKIIHYCWYGNSPKPDCFEKCYASWKKYAPDYEIIEWNESNTDLNQNLFVQQAYAAKKYAFVSDVVRLKVLYDYGGVYLDADVELRGPLDELLKYSAFFSYNINDKVNTGDGFGAEKNDLVIKKMLDDYDTMEFADENVFALACPEINTRSISSALPGFACENKSTLIGNYAFFSSFDYRKYTFHYCNFSWGSEEYEKAKQYKKKRIRFFRIRRFLRNPKIFEFFRKYKLKKIGNIYRLCVYDVMDNGVVYYGYRLIQKIQKAAHK